MRLRQLRRLSPRQRQRLKYALSVLLFAASAILAYLPIIIINSVPPDYLPPSVILRTSTLTLTIEGGLLALSVLIKPLRARVAFNILTIIAIVFSFFVAFFADLNSTNGFALTVNAFYLGIPVTLEEFFGWSNFLFSFVVASYFSLAFLALVLPRK